MEFSTPITEILCAQVMEDTIKVIVDHHYAKKKSKIDTGNWELICKKKPVESNPKNACGLNFECVGTKMKVKKSKPQAKAKKIPIVEITHQIKETKEEDIQDDSDEDDEPSAKNDEESEDEKDEDDEVEESNNYDAQDAPNSPPKSPFKNEDDIQPDDE